MISGLQPQPGELLESTGLLDMIGRQNIFARTGPAIDMAISEMELGICATCQYSAFRECADLKRKGIAEVFEIRKETL
jgi:hypothetical protein